MARHLLMLRHGETFANLEKRLDTRVPGAALTERGKEQAREWGRQRDPRSLTLIGTSEALRARQTGREILNGMREAFPHVAQNEFPELRIIPGIYETQVGDWEDGIIDDVNLLAKWFGLFLTWLKGDWETSSPGPLGENARMVADRAMPQIHALYEEFFNGTSARAQDQEKDVLLVAHGAIIPLMTTMMVPDMDKRFAFWSFLGNTDTVTLQPRAQEAALAGEAAAVDQAEQLVWDLLRWGSQEPPFICDVPEENDNVEAIANLKFSSMGKRAAAPQVPGVGTGKAD